MWYIHWSRSWMRGAAHTLRFNQFTAFLDNYFTSTFPQKSKLFFSSDVYTVLTWSYVTILPFYRVVWVQTVSIYSRLHFWNQTIFPIPSNFFRIYEHDLTVNLTWYCAVLDPVLSWLTMKLYCWRLGKWCKTPLITWHN